MSQRTATIERLPMAFEVVKAMRADGLEWGEGYRPLGRQALAEIIQGRMAEAVDDWLDSLDGSAMRDRRNGSYSRHLLTELGDTELSVPRTRRFCPSEVLRSYARRAPEIDRGHPGRLRARALNPQGGRGLVGPARPQGLGLDREPRCQDPG